MLDAPEQTVSVVALILGEGIVLIVAIAVSALDLQVVSASLTH